MKVCIETAKKIGKIRDCGTLTFVRGFPRCAKANVQLQSCHGAVHIRTKLLACDAKEASFVIGKGQAPNGVFGYTCEDSVCYPIRDVPDVLPKCS